MLYFATMHTFFSAYQQSDGFGKLIFWGLFFLSCLTWIVLLQKIWVFRNLRKLSLDFESAIQKEKDWILNVSKETLPKLSFRETPHPFARIFFALKQKTLEILEKNHKYGEAHLEKEEGKQNPVYLSSTDMELVASHIETTISKEIKGLEKNLFILSTIVTLAPFLGLLGTVWGILISFSQLQSGASAQSSSVILGGLSTALTTTVLGLLIAIPALIGYNYLKNGAKNLFSDMHHFSSNLLSIIELQYRKVDAS